jgi:hypothetical protein
MAVDQLLRGEERRGEKEEGGGDFDNDRLK